MSALTIASIAGNAIAIIGVTILGVMYGNAKAKASKLEEQFLHERVATFVVAERSARLQDVVASTTTDLEECRVALANAGTAPALANRFNNVLERLRRNGRPGGGAGVPVKPTADAAKQGGR